MKNYFTKDDEKLKWTDGGAKTLMHTVVCDITSHHNTSSSGVSGDYIIMDAPEWVVVIPEKEKTFLMVKQWRHGINALSVEFPGGVVDRGEEPEVAARRELEEETGCKAGKLIKLGELSPNPALFNNHVHIYLAQDLQATGSQHLDEDEFINCVELTKEEVFNAIGTEQFPHAIMATAMMFYVRYSHYSLPCQARQ